MLKENTIRTVKETIPVLKSRGLEITERMYTLLFQQQPHLEQIFEDQKQSVELANAMLVYASNIDRLETLTNAVINIPTRDGDHNIRPEHYVIVGKCLLQAIDEIASPSPEVLNAWEDAYGFLANMMIEMEKQLYPAPQREVPLATVS